MKRKTPMMKRWFALLLAGLLMVAPAVLAEEENGAGFGTFFQPEGVELCEVEDAGSLSVPDGLSGLYALMQDCNPFASAYVFRMPKDAVTAAIEAAGFDARIRPEALTLEDFAKIQQALAR